MTRVQQTASAMLFVAVLILGGWSWSQDNSPSDRDPAQVDPAEVDAATVDPATVDHPSVDLAPVDPAPVNATPALAANSETPATPASVSERPQRQGVITNLTIFVLAVFLGIEVISKVPPTLHTPLMSGSNAISGIALVGAVIVASAVVDELSPAAGVFARCLGFIAVTLAMINAVGGFMVTHRMLSMFTRK
jgi:NAD(P) transhydrogenase subunit alpha